MRPSGLPLQELAFLFQEREEERWARGKMEEEGKKGEVGVDFLPSSHHSLQERTDHFNVLPNTSPCSNLWSCLSLCGVSTLVLAGREENLSGY